MTYKVTTPHTQVGAMAWDSLAFPCKGAQSVIEVVDLSPYTGSGSPPQYHALVVWVGLIQWNGWWIQIGYGSQNGGPTSGFLQVWDLNTFSIFDTQAFPITLGRHAFGVVYNDSTQYWDATYDSDVVASYLTGADKSAGGSLWFQSGLSFNGGPTLYCAIENLNGDTFPVDVNFPLALAVKQLDGKWVQMNLGVEVGGQPEGGFLIPHYGVSASGNNSVTMGPSEPFNYFFPIWILPNANPPSFPTSFSVHTTPMAVDLTLFNPNDSFQRVWAVFIDQPPVAYLGNGQWLTSDTGAGPNPAKYLVGIGAEFSGQTLHFIFQMPSGKHSLYPVVSSPPALGTYSGPITLTLPNMQLVPQLAGINYDNHDTVTANYDMVGITIETPASPPGIILIPRGITSTMVVVGLGIGTVAAIAGITAYRSVRKKRDKR